MTALLKITTNRGSTLTLLDGSVDTGYMLPHGADFGNVDWENSFSGHRGLLGNIATFAVPKNREISIPVRIAAISKGDMASRVNAVTRIIEELRNFGGLLYWQAPGSSYRIVFTIFTAGDSWETSASRAIARNVVEGLIVLGAAPLGEGDPLSFVEKWETNTITAGDWVIDAGSTPTVSGGRLIPNGTSVVYVRRVAEGYEYDDVEIEIAYVAGSTSAIGIAALLGIQAANNDNLLDIGFDSTGVLDIRTRSSDTDTSVASSFPTTYPPSAAGDKRWLISRREGSLLTAEHWTSEPTPKGSPTATQTWVMTAAQAALFNQGRIGFRLDPGHVDDRIETVTVRANKYRNLAAPDVIRVPLIPGTHGPRFEVEIAADGSTGTNPAVWAQVAWWERPTLWNMIWNGDLEDSTLDTNGWSSSSFSLNSGSTLSRVTTAAKYGAGSLQAVTTNASSNQGASFTPRWRFDQGKTYLAWGWVRAASGTNNVQIVAGSTATDNSISSPSKALSTAWQFLSTTWRPTAEREGLFGVAFRTTAAVTQTFTVDGVGLCETVATTIAANMLSSDSTVTLRHVPDDVPVLPALAVIGPGTTSAEIVRVTGITASVATIERGMEGSTAATHSINDEFCFMPEFLSHVEGAGAYPTFGIIEGEAYGAVGGTNAWATATDATARGGSSVSDTALAAGAGNMYAEYQIDPALVAPDNYTQASETVIEVYGRFSIDVDADVPTVVLSATAPYTQRRYAAEFGSEGTVLVEPTSGTVWRYVFLGTMRLPADRLNPQRWTLRVDYSWGPSTTIAASGALDYLILIPANKRAASPEGKVNDSTYPKFIGQVAETIKTIRSDLSGVVRKPSGSGRAATQDIGLGGNVLELPASKRGWEVLVKLSNLVTGDPTIDTTTEDAAHAVHVRIGMTPRFGIMRDA